MAVASTGLAFGGVGGDAQATRAPFGAPLPAGCDSIEEGLVCNLNVSVIGPGKVTGAGIDCPTDCLEQVTIPSGVATVSRTLTAVPSPGAVFSGWSGDCTGAALTCDVTLPPGRDVTATFTTAPGGCSSSSGGLLCTLNVTVNGPGKVTAPGIDCPGDCTEQVLANPESPKTVTLTATPNEGATLSGWSGDCTGTGSCNVTLPPGRSVTAAFAQGSAPPAPPSGQEPEIGDTSEPQLPDSLPAPARELEVNLSGNGNVVGRVVGSSRAPIAGRFAGGSVSIRCGTQVFRCEAKLSPGTVVTFEATPGAGFVFGGWRGPCAGQGTTCRVVLEASRSISAIFLPRNASSQVQVELGDPVFRVRWKQSVGRGSLVLRGRAARAAALRIQVRRPGGGPLLSDQISVPGGSFRRSLSLAPGLLPRGARVLPGGFVVTLTGRSGGLPVGFQLRTAVLAAPPEGVVRNAFVSSSETGTPKGLSAGATQAFAHFVFAAQPAAGQSLTVSWYRPDGSLLGSAQKSNRPRIFSFIKSGSPLPSGVWRAELKAGAKLVRVLRVRIPS
jgi:hypothetical protein